MTDEEYTKAIYEILSSERGYKAISDLSKSLETRNEKHIKVAREMKAERKIIKKILEKSTSSNKEKIKVVLSLING